VPTSPSPLPQAENRFALRVARHLDAAAEAVPHDISQRLRFGREQALRAARLAAVQQAQAATATLRDGTMALRGLPWPWRVASLLPLVVLLGGLYLIGQVHRSQQIHAAAEVDAVLLADELPPAAYTDPGFAEYLKRTLP
jgi:hypothetical protein